jgi:hypothetical protein
LEGLVGDVEEEEKKRNVSDLPGATVSEADLLLDKVYGDYVHQNSGQHLDGGIVDDEEWQNYWRRLIVYHSLTYDAPKGAVGKRFVEELAVIIQGIISRKWNAERFIIFQMVILQRARGVSGSGAIRARIINRLDAWKRGEFLSLVQMTERDMKASLTSKQKGTTPEQRAKIFNQKLM